MQISFPLLFVVHDQKYRRNTVVLKLLSYEVIVEDVLRLHTPSVESESLWSNTLLVVFF